MWKSASASGSPDSTLTGSSPDKRVVDARLACGSARVGAGQAPASARATARPAGALRPRCSVSRGAGPRARRSASRARERLLQVGLLGARLAAAAPVQDDSQRRGQQAEHHPPITCEPLGERGPCLGRGRCLGLLDLGRGLRCRRRLGLLGRGRGFGRRRAGRGASVRRAPAPVGASAAGARLARGRLALQRRELGVLDLEQAPRLGQFRLELLHTRLQLRGRRGTGGSGGGAGCCRS